MNELTADGIPVAVTCRVLNIVRQPYCRWLACPVTDTELTQAYRADALFDAHRDDPEFGYRFLTDETRAGDNTAMESFFGLLQNNGHCCIVRSEDVFGLARRRESDRRGEFGERGGQA